MILNVYSIYDSKIDAYITPFYCHSHAEACRVVSQSAADPKTKLHQYPADFTLFCIAKYDDSTGEFSSVSDDPSVFEHLGNIVSVVSSQASVKDLSYYLKQLSEQKSFDD